jgi:hypothetical protein
MSMSMFMFMNMDKDMDIGHGHGHEHEQNHKHKYVNFPYMTSLLSMPFIADRPCSATIMIRGKLLPQYNYQQILSYRVN